MLKVLPLGGLGEVGLNNLVIEHAGERLLVDCGLMFGQSNQPGVEIVIPDFELIRADPHAVVAIVLTHAHEDHLGALPYLLRDISVPIYGTANCGPRTIYASQNLEGYLKVSKKLLTKRDKIFALRAEGNSLNKANINGKNIEDGDFVIIDSQATNPKNGDYIVSIIEEMANIKKYIWDAKNSQIILGSESTQNYNPIYVHEDDNIIINGKVIDVIKKPSI